MKLPAAPPAVRPRRGPGRAVAFAALLLSASCAVQPFRAPGAGGPESPEPSLLDARFVAPARVVQISLAGLTPERLAPGSRLGALAGMARRGASAGRVEGVAPASHWPAHASLVTGERPADHGVTADRLLGERDVRNETHDHASLIRAPTLWQVAREHGRGVAALGWPSTVGSGVASLLPEVAPRRAGETHAALLRDTASADVLALAEGARLLSDEAARAGPVRDRALVDLACGLVARPAAPALWLLRLSQTEPILLHFGPESPEADAAFASADREVARLLACFASAGRLGDTAWFVTGDRRFEPVHTAISPNTVLAAAGLVDVEAGTPWRAVSRANGASAFVYAHDDRDAVSARRSLAQAADDTRAFRVVSAQEMLALGADPRAWFGLEARAGYLFDDLAAGPLLRPAAQRAADGYLPGEGASGPAFLAYGAGIRPGVRVPLMRLTDVAPTIARVLRLPLGPSDGRVLVGVLSSGDAVATEGR